MKIKKLFKFDGQYFIYKNRVKIHWIVPVMIIVGLFTLPFLNYVLLNLCFVVGFFCKYQTSKIGEKKK